MNYEYIMRIMSYDNFNFPGILRRKVSCSEHDVIDLHRRRMVRHISGRAQLLRSFAGFWRIWNNTLPWNEGAAVELRRGIPKLPRVNSRLEALKQMRERRKELEEMRMKKLDSEHL